MSYQRTLAYDTRFKANQAVELVDNNVPPSESDTTTQGPLGNSTRLEFDNGEISDAGSQDNTEDSLEASTSVDTHLSRLIQNVTNQIAEIPNYQASNDLFYKNSKEKKIGNGYFVVVKPVLILWTALGRFPYNVSEDGVEPFSICSRSMIYCILMYFLQVLLSLKTYEIIYNEIYIKANDFNDVLTAFIFALFLPFNLLIPVINWWEAKKMIKFIAKWRIFQKRFLNENYQWKSKRIFKIFTIIVVPYCTVTNCCLLLLVSNVNFLITVAYIPIAICLHINIGLWILTLYEIRVITEKLCKRILIDGLFYDTDRRRRMWVSLRTLSTEAGTTFSNQLLFFLFTFFCVIVTSTYSFIQNVVNPSEDRLPTQIAHLYSVLLALVFVSVLSVQAQQTVEALGKNFTYKILSLRITNQDERYTFLLLRFLETMKNCPSLIELSGYILMDKGLVLSYYSGTLTYMIVLIQLQSPLHIASNQTMMTPGWVKQIYHLNGIDMCEYGIEMKPLLIVLRMLGRFPYSINERGYRFSVLSYPTVYTLLFYVIKCSISVWSIGEMLKSKITTAATYDEIIFWLLLACLNIMDFIVPATYWLDAPNMVAYINKWKAIEGLPSKGHGRGATLPARLALMLAVPLATIALLAESFIIRDISPFVFLQLFPLVTAAVITLAVWKVTLMKLERMAASIIAGLQEVDKYELCKRRRAWLQMSSLARDLGTATGKSVITFCGALFCTFVICLYGVLVDLEVASKYSALGLALGGCPCFLYNFILCDISHNAIIKIGDNFTTTILKIDLRTKTTSYRNEIDLFLKAIKTNPPVIAYMGLISVNRKLFTYFLGNGVTYLIVLLQFKVSTPAKPLATHNGILHSTTNYF